MTKKKSTPRQEISLDAQVAERIVSQLTTGDRSLQDLELQLESVKRKIGQMLLQKAMANVPPESGSPKPCPKCGKKVAVKSTEVRRTIETMSGRLELLRNQHYCGDCKSSFFPRDIELGLPERGDLSAELEKRVLDFATHDTFQGAADRMTMHYELRLSSNQFRKVTERIGAQIEASTHDLLQLELLPPESKPPERLYVMNDGSMISMQDGTWREVKLGMVFGENAEGKGQNGNNQKSANVRYEAILGNQDEFFNAMKSMLDTAEVDTASEVTWLADGAPGNWGLALACCPRATQILDIVHAIENGMTCAKALLGENSELLPYWQTCLENLFFERSPAAVISEFMDCTLEATDDQLQAINDYVRYCRENQSRMEYKLFLSRGLLIGSGPIEAAHRHVIQKRMKQAGQHWGEETGRRMARLRAATQTAGASRVYDAIRNAHRKSTCHRAARMDRGGTTAPQSAGVKPRLQSVF